MVRMPVEMLEALLLGFELGKEHRERDLNEEALLEDLLKQLSELAEEEE